MRNRRGIARGCRSGRLIDRREPLPGEVGDARDILPLGAAEQDAPVSRLGAAFGVQVAQGCDPHGAALDLVLDVEGRVRHEELDIIAFECP